MTDDNRTEGTMPADNESDHDMTDDNLLHEEVPEEEVLVPSNAVSDDSVPGDVSVNEADLSDVAEGSTPAAAEDDVSESVRRVREAQQELGGIDAQPLTEQIETYDDVHAKLQDSLAELDGA
ncbi:MAG: hypothetical protein ABIM89_16560 [Mycobacteriales bacterium]